MDFIDNNLAKLWAFVTFDCGFEYVYSNDLQVYVLTEFESREYGDTFSSFFLYIYQFFFLCVSEHQQKTKCLCRFE